MYLNITIPFIYNCIGHEGNLRAELLCLPRRLRKEFRRTQADAHIALVPALPPPCRVPYLPSDRYRILHRRRRSRTDGRPAGATGRSENGAQVSSDAHSLTSVQLAGYLLMSIGRSFDTIRSNCAVGPCPAGRCVPADRRQGFSTTEGHTSPIRHATWPATVWKKPRLPFAFMRLDRPTRGGGDPSLGLQHALTFGIEHTYRRSSNTV